MNFNIVDGDNGYRELLPVFSEMYNDNRIPVATIKEQLQLGPNAYRKLRRDAIEDGLIKARRGPNRKKETYKTNPKYICTTHYSNIAYFKVIRRREGKVSYYGIFKDYRQAERMVELLEEHDWDINLRHELKEQVMREWNCQK